MTTRPYRVGMARAAQRYIAPDEIYEDMGPRARVEMPREFPFSWNPVNGLSGADDVANQWHPREGRADPRREEHMAAGLGRGYSVGSWSSDYAAHRGMRGLGAAGASTTSIADDFLNAIKDVGGEVVEGGKDKIKEKVGSGVEDFIRSGPGAALLDAVEAKAQEGVVKVVKEQAPNLMMLAVAGGAVGGVVSAKLGTLGTIAAIGVALFAANRLLSAGAGQAPVDPKARKK